MAMPCSSGMNLPRPKLMQRTACQSLSFAMLRTQLTRHAGRVQIAIDHGSDCISCCFGAGASCESRTRFAEWLSKPGTRQTSYGTTDPHPQKKGGSHLLGLYEGDARPFGLG